MSGEGYQPLLGNDAPRIVAAAGVYSVVWPGVSVTAQQWTLDNVDVPGATGATYVASFQDAGKTVGCRISVTALVRDGDVQSPPADTFWLVDTAGAYQTDGSGNRLFGISYVDDPAISVRQLTASKGIAFGTSIQGSAKMNAPGPSGYATRMDWLSANVDVFVPGSVMMPDTFNTSFGNYNMTAVSAFVQDAITRGKQFRGHCAYYPKRDLGTWVDAYLASNPGQWQVLQHARMDALAGVSGLGSASNFDVLNELFSVGSGNPGGWRTSAFTTAAGSFVEPPVSAFKKMRSLFPTMPLFWCQDLSEQLASGTLRTHAANILAGIEACLDAGAPIDGYASQAHLTYRLGFSAVDLRDFYRSLTSGLGLRLIVSELDARTGYGSGFNDTPPPSAYTINEYDRIGADFYKRYLDIALPFVVESGGDQFISWTLDDGYNSWTGGSEPPGERPCPYDDNYQPKQQYYALRNALLEI